MAPHLPSLVWNLRSRYRDVAGQREYETYMASKPPDPIDIAREQEVRADIEYLLHELHLRYAMLPIREKLHSSLVIWVNGILQTAGLGCVAKRTGVPSNASRCYVAD